MAAPLVRERIELNAQNVYQIVDQINERIAGPSFNRFLQGPGHEYFGQQIEWNFEGEGSAWGGRWSPLTDATQDIRGSLGYDPSHPINQRTGDMFKVLTEEADYTFGNDWAEMSLPGKAGRAYPMFEKIVTAQMGRSAEENPIWQFGETPARPVFGLREYDAERVLAALTVWVVADLAGPEGAFF